MPDASLFNVEWVPRWSTEIVNFLSTAVLPSDTQDEKVEFVKGASKFSLIAGHLYYRDQDSVLKLVVCPEEYFQILRDAHVLSCGQHLGKDQTVRIVRWQGYWWPTLHEDAATYVRSCVTCRANDSVLHATLYHPMGVPQYAQYIFDYITKGDIQGKNKAKQRIVILESQKYRVLGSQVYRACPDGNLRLCVPENKYIEVLSHAHAGAGSGHFGAKTTSQMILYSGLWWPTLFMDCQEFVKRCDMCQRNRVPNMYDEMPLRPIVSTRAFAKWGIDFVGPLPPAKESNCQYIIVATDYLTKWAEAMASTKNDAHTTAKFLYEHIFVRFGLPIEIVSDQGTHFINAVVGELLNEFLVAHRKSAPYHPQANGQAESTNKVLCTALTKIVDGNRSHWEKKLPSVLWAYRTAYKTAVGSTPFELVYGLNAVLPIEFLMPTLRVAAELEWDGHAMSNRLSELQNLDERRLTAVHAMYVEKRRRKAWHDKNLRLQEFKEGDLVLLYTLKKAKRKLTSRGLGPYVINTITSGGAIRLETLDGHQMANFINGSRLRRYHEPLTEEILARLHAAKNEKERQAQLIAEAQMEAKLRAQKNRERRRYINCITTSCKEDDYDPPILIHLFVQGQQMTALIDSGADANVLFYEAYAKLQCGLQKTSTWLTSFTKTDSEALGITTLCLSQSNFTCEGQFYIAQQNQSNHDLILSRAWMRKHRCTIDWVQNAVHLGTNAKRVMLPIVMETTLASPTPPVKTKELCLAPERVLFVRGTNDNEASTSQASTKPPTHINKFANKPSIKVLLKKHTQQMSPNAQKMWIPKTALLAQGYYKDIKTLWLPTATVHPSPKPEPLPKVLTQKRQQRAASSRVTTRWVPKSLLKAQGYGHGTAQIWLPKATKPKQPPQEKLKHPKKDPISCAISAKSTMYWRPKQKNTPKPTLVPQRKQQTATKCQKKWVPKQPSQKKINDTSIKVAGTTKPTEVPTQAYSGKKSRYPTIKERARALQIKLFGLRSLPTI